jgi:O-antigen/teichoic acid export membrane protein
MASDPPATERRLSWLSLRPLGSFGRGVLLVATGTAFGQAVLALSSPALTRLYDPEDFAALAVFTGLLFLLMAVASLRYAMTIPLAPDSRMAADLVGVSLAVLAAVVLLVATGVWLLGEHVQGWTNAPEGPYLWLLPVALLVAGINEVLSYWAIRKKAFDRVAQARISQAFVQALTQIGLGVVHAAPIGLVLGSVVGRAGGTGRFASLALLHDRPAFAQISRSGMRAAASRYRNFPLISTGSGLVAVAAAQIPALLIGAFFGAKVLGLFALSQRVVGLPMILLGNAVSQAYLGHAAELFRSEPARLQELFQHLSGRLAAAGLVPIGLLAIGGPWMFSHLFGPDWSEAGTYVRVLAVMYFVQFVTGPLGDTLVILERLRLRFFYDASRLALGIGALVAAHAAGWSAVEAIALYGGVMACASVLGFSLNSLALHQAAR